MGVIGIVGGGIHQGQGRVPLNPHEQIVHIMGDAAGQRAEGFQALGLLQLRLELFLFGFHPCLIGHVRKEIEGRRFSVPIDPHTVYGDPMDHRLIIDHTKRIFFRNVLASQSPEMTIDDQIPVFRMDKIKRVRMRQQFL